MNNILILAGGAALLLWYFTQKATTTTTGTTTGTTPGATTPTATPTATTPSSTPTTPTSSGAIGSGAAYNSLAAIEQRVQADAIANAEPSLISAYAWNVYLGRNANVTPPDPSAIFADASSPITFAAYWSGTSAYLAANLGMSGLGRVPWLQQVRGGWIA